MEMLNDILTVVKNITHQFIIDDEKQILYERMPMGEAIRLGRIDSYKVRKYLDNLSWLEGHTAEVVHINKKEAV